MAALAQALDERGDARRAEAAWKEVRDAAVSVAFPRFKVEALSHVAVQLSRARRVVVAERMLSEAVDRAESIGDANEKKSALAEAAVAHATIGRCVRALDIAGDLGDSGYSIREIAASCADPGCVRYWHTTDQARGSVTRRPVGVVAGAEVQRSGRILHRRAALISISNPLSILIFGGWP